MTNISSSVISTEEYLNYYESLSYRLQRDLEDSKNRISELESHINNIEPKLMKLAFQLWESTQNA